MQDPLSGLSDPISSYIFSKPNERIQHDNTNTSAPPNGVGQVALYNIFKKETDELILANTTIHHALRTLRFTKASSSRNLRNTARYERYSFEGYYARFAN